MALRAIVFAKWRNRLRTGKEGFLLCPRALNPCGCIMLYFYAAEWVICFHAELNWRFNVAVGQSIDNCPRYTQNGRFEFERDPATTASAPASVSAALNDTVRQIIADADTFFVAS
jgi:hypothetical protein